MKRLLYLLFAAVAVTACAPAVPAGEFLIAGKIKNVPDSAVVFLYVSQGQSLCGIGTDTLIDGRFSLRDTIASPKAAQVCLYIGDYRGGALEVWIAPGECTEIRGEGEQAWLWEVVSDIPEQKDEDMYRALVEPEVRELNQFQDILTPQDMARYMELCGQISEKTVRYMQTAPVTQVWINRFAECARFLLYGIGLDHKAEMLALYDRMTEEQRQSPMGRQIGDCLHPTSKVGVGDLMADGDLYDVDGNIHHLADFLGKYILLEFGGKGCGACLEAIPELKEIAERYRNRMEVVCVSSDSEHDWKQFVAERQLTGNQWNQLLGIGEGIWARYGVLGIPHFVLIAPDGRVQDIWVGYGKGSLLEKIAENIK